MSFWKKGQEIAKKIKEIGTRSIRKIAEATGYSKSSVHRHQKGKERRDKYRESHLWETEEGQQWLKRLVVASIFHFGLKRGVGVGSISDFLETLQIETHVGISETALRGVKQGLEKQIIEYGQVNQEKGVKVCGRKEIVGGVDETFFEEMVLVMLDLPSGYLIMEEFSKERTYKSWQEKVEQSLETLRFEVSYLVSDRATALIKLATENFGCRSIADLFHPLHEISKGFSFAIHNSLKQAKKKLDKETEPLVTIASESEEGEQLNEKQQELWQEVKRWEGVQEQYIELRQQFSLSVHPFAVSDNAPQNAASVEKKLQETVSALENMAKTNQLSKSEKHLKPVKNQLGDLASLMNVWWDWVEQTVTEQASDFLRQHWLKEMLLPKVYWEHQLKRCRSPFQRPFYKTALNQAQQRLNQHPFTPFCQPVQWKQYNQWAETMVTRFQRTSSPVEGRNGYLSRINQARRGLSHRCLQVLTILHNFDLKRSDNTTAAQRFFGISFPDLFESVLPLMPDLPLPRTSPSLKSISPVPP